MSSLSFMFGSMLQKDNEMIQTTIALQGKEKIGVYFTASWCPPCKKFTPLLKETYLEISKHYNDFEIVSIHRCRNEQEYNEYRSTMPWLSVPFFHSIDQKIMTMGVGSIPRLVILDNKGQVINPDARRAVEIATWQDFYDIL